ncbi:MAG: hypothetical protein IJS59_09595, partial [Bacteroidaceae bacterium]|nr:hypothetical protein [Bacteroidaceae bacterium]
IEMTVGQAPGAAPSVPAAIRGAFIDSFEYYASDGTSPMTTLPANDAIIVVKNYVVSATPALDLTGEQKYNLQVNGSYAYDNSGSLALNASAAHTLPYVWALTGGDPYHLSVVNQSTGTLLTQTFILTEGAADGQYELLQASGNSTMNYLGTADGSTTSVASGTWEHKDAAIQLELEAPDVNYTFVIVDLSNKQALQSPAHTGKGGQALVLDEFMQSPLVQTYTFYSTHDNTQATAAAGLSGDLGGKLPYADCTVYVGYTPYAVADAPLKLDGSVYYGLFSKTKGMDGIFADSQVRGNNTAIPYTDATLNNREKHFYWQLSGTEVSGQYDPYDVRIYNPANERYWTNTIWVAGNQSGSQQVTVHNTSDRYYYMILKGSSGEYVELMSKKRLTDTYYLDRIASYQYIYFDNTKLTTGQHATNYVHGNDNMQFHLQPAYTYHVITLDGKEAISAIGTKMETSTDGATPTAPAIPGLIESPLVNTYHYYDVTAFDIDGDTYTLKEGATQLTRLVDATTKDIYVVYDRSDLSSAIDLTGQMAYNMQVNSRYVYYNSSDNNDFYSTDETTSITDNNYLWQFSGGDPYALKLLNPSKPGFVVSNNDEESSYRGATGLVSPQRAINTYMLLRGYGSDGYDYRLMSSPVAETDKQNNPFYYQYIGGNARNWGRTAGTLNYKVAWVNAGDHGQYLYQTSDLIQLKLTRQNAATYTYTVVSAEGTPLVSYTVNGTAGVTPEIPERIRSPFAKDFTYLDAATGGNVVTATANDATIYVRYALDPEATLDLSGSISYNMQTNGSYAYSNAGALATEATPADRTHDEYIWLIEGSDPYQARLKNVKTGTYLAYEGTTVTFSPTPSTFVMLEGNDSRHVELMATGQDASLTTALNLGRADDATTLALYAQATYAHLAPQLEIAFRKTGSPIHWHIIDNAGREAISYTQIYADDFPALTFANIPAAIRSPYLEDETLTFYTVATEDATAADGRATYILSSPITTIPASGAPNIYVRYTTGHLAAKPLTLDGVNGYDMRLNNHYIYEFNGNLTHNTNIPASGDRSYLWRIAGGDPYAVTVQNAESGLYFRHNISGDTHTLSLDDDEAGRTFIAMQYIDWEDEGNGVARMELMAATGADLSTEHYYSVGRGNENVTLFGSNTHEHGNQMLKVVLHVGLRDISYNIIDRAGKIIATIPYSTGGVASLPDEWKSPMVSRYYYWQASQFVDANTDGVPDEPWTLIDGATETPNEADYPHRQVYVTYDVITNTADANYIDMNTGVTDYSERVRRVSGDDTTPMVRDASKYGTMYMLKFLDGTADYLEDGHDAVLADAYKPVYPYANGDGQMYVRHEEAWEAEKSAGASTRTRWPWFILSPTNDPYHIYITAWQNSHAADNTNYYNFLHTYYNSTIGQVVTSTISDDPRVRLYNATTNPSGSTADAGGSDDNVPTEYMLLGTKGHYRLRTTDAIADATTTSHRDVTTFEQYWKNNPTVLDLAGSNPAANNATLTALGWHRYQAWANAVPFAGGSRVFEHVNHWYKTIDMGAEFDLVPTQIDAVLVLLDNHGWEVMRRNIPKHSETARYAEARQALQLWDSPMVSQYRFYGYRNAPKDAGYHKYTVAANTLEGTAASLADYPERFSGGAIYDLYVHYDVRPEYAQGYTAAATKGESSATAYVIQQGTDYAQAAAAGATAITPVAKADADITSATDDMLWYVQRNFNIDAEMGYVYNDAINGVGSKAETEAAYMASTILSNGLDPYALQLKNKQYGQYFKVTGITAAALNGSSWAYDGTPAVGLSATLDDLTATGNDNTTVHITNATFMAVGDGNGNIRLMPRFDHDRVLTGFATIEAHQAAAPANDDGSHSTQTTLFLLPNPYTYIIVDNSGRESVRFQSAGDVGPQIKAQYRSPLATNFRFYKTAGGTEGSYTFDNADLITTFAGIALTDNKVYVRYDYDRTADVYGLLKGAKATMQIGDTYVQYADDVIKSGTLDNSLAVWQWRLTANVTDSPDPYAVPLYNRNEANAMSAGIPGTSPLTASTTPSRFALLPHATDLSGAPVGTNDYSLLLAGTKTHDNYYYLDGTDLTTGATTAALTPGAATYVPTLTTPQKVHFDFVAPATVTYKLITDDGRVALETTVTPTTPYTAEMPAWMKTPLMTSDAYIYCTSATGSDATTWTVDENSWTQTVLNLGDDNTIYVRYHYDDSKTAVGHSNGRASNVSVLDLSGTVPYYLKLHTWQWTDYDGSKVTIDGEGNNENHINTAALWHLGGNDPYAITFSNYTWDAGKVLSATDPATDKTHTTLTMQERGADGYPHQTFMILSGGTSYIYAYATGSQRLHLSEQGTSTGITLYRDDKDYSAYTDRNQIHNKQPYASFRFYPALFYHVITNAGQEALSIQSPLTLTTVTIEGYKTPLLPANAYHYYTEAPTVAAGIVTPQGDEIAEGTSTGVTAGRLITNLWVRYDAYDRATSPMQYPDGIGSSSSQGLDLSGETWYNMGRVGGKVNYILQSASSYTDAGTQYDAVETGWKNGGDLSPNFWYEVDRLAYLNGTNTALTDITGENGKTTSPRLSAKQMLWRFEGNDPYAIRIYNASQSAGPLTVNDGNNRFSFTATGDYQQFMMLAARGQDDRTVRWADEEKSTYVDCNLFLPTGKTDRFLNIRDNVVTTYNFHYWTGQWALNTRLGRANSGVQGGWVSFFKAPISRRYHYYAMKDDGTGNWVAAWDAVLMHDWMTEIELDNQISRLYTKYERRDEDYSTGTDVTASGDFQTRATLEAGGTNAQFYADADLTTRVEYDGSYDIYPDFEEDSYPNGYPIYFKYQPMTNLEIAALTGTEETNFRWSTEEQITADVATHQANHSLFGTEADGTTPLMKASWQFMVLDTDAAFTNSSDDTTVGKQYFLRHEDDGTVAWMNNGYQLYADQQGDNGRTLDDYTTAPSRNYKQWSYNRVAEYFKDGENEEFREGRWLWAFVGDPYNLNVVNFEARSGIVATSEGTYHLAPDAATVTAYRDSTLANSTHAYPVMTHTELEGIAASTTSTEHSTTAAERSQRGSWGLAVGSTTHANEATFALVSNSAYRLADTDDPDQLYWQMTTPASGTGHVQLSLRATDRSNAIRTLPYEPMAYQDVVLTIRRMDDCVSDADGTKGTGTKAVYYAQEDRMFCEGDVIDNGGDKFPTQARRQFCTYKFYTDKFATLGTEYTVWDASTLAIDNLAIDPNTTA